MAEDHSSRRIIFICGADHSGSTLIGCALASEPGVSHDVFHVGECHAFFDKAHPKFAKVPANSSVWPNVDANVSTGDVYAEIFRNSGARIVVDSSKKLEWALAQARACKRSGIDFSVLVTIRPFAELIYSLTKRDVELGQAIKRIKYYRAFLRFIDRANPSAIYGVDTKNFCEDPAVHLEALCRIMDIPYFPGKEMYWNFRHQHLFGASVQRRQIHAKAGSYEVRQLPEGFVTKQLQRRMRTSGLLDLEDRVRQLIPADIRAR
jgi:hypothetical protein